MAKIEHPVSNVGMAVAAALAEAKGTKPTVNGYVVWQHGMGKTAGLLLVHRTCAARTKAQTREPNEAERLLHPRPSCGYGELCVERVRRKVRRQQSRAAAAE